MEATNYDYILTGLTMVFWLSPLILLASALTAKYIAKIRGPVNQDSTLSDKMYHSAA